MGTERIVSSYRAIANLRGQNVQTNLMMSLGNCRPTTEREECSSVRMERGDDTCVWQKVAQLEHSCYRLL